MVSVSLVTFPARRAAANDDAALIGGVLGIVGAIALMENANRRQNAQEQQQKQQRQQVAQRPSRPAAEIEADKAMQEALNYFGFDAGPVDGSPGARTRAAVSSFQSAMNFPVNGRISADERRMLADARAWAAYNPQQANQVAAASPLGQRGLPAAYRDITMGRPVPGLAEAGAVAVAAAPRPAAQAPAVKAIAPITLPSMPTVPSRSMADLCNQTTNFTAANNGLATPANMPDPTLALNEQFCLARGFAISDAKQISDSNSYSQEQITSVCASVNSAVASAVTDYGTRPVDDVLAAMDESIARNNWTAQQVEAAGRMCLGEGYRTDDAVLSGNMAIVLSASGRAPYAEAVSHHLREGFGTAANPAASKAWMQMALERVAAIPIRDSHEV